MVRSPQKNSSGSDGSDGSKPIAAAAHPWPGHDQAHGRCHLRRQTRPLWRFSGDRNGTLRKKNMLESESGIYRDFIDIKGIFEYVLMETIPKTMPKSVFRGGGFMLQWSLIQIFRFVTFLSFWGVATWKSLCIELLFFEQCFFRLCQPRINWRYCFRSQRHQIWGQLQEINLGWSRFDIVRRGVRPGFVFL